MSSCANPRRLDQPKGHISGFFECVQLCRQWTINLKSSHKGQEEALTSINIVPFSLFPLQYCAGCERLKVQSGYKRQIGIPHPRGCKMYIDAPPERRNCRADDWILVDSNNFRVLEDRQRFVRDFRHLPSNKMSTCYITIWSRIAGKITLVP